MNDIIFISIILAIFGLLAGSFAGASVWRVRARQLLQDKKAKEPYDKAELKRLLPLTKATLANDRSRCLHCAHRLKWYDLLPLISWMSTKGRCRYCKQPIGYFEPLIEVGTAAAFGIFSYAWLLTYGLELMSLALLLPWIVVITMLVILFAYDYKWYMLPDVVMYPLIGLSIIIAGLTSTVLHPVDLVAVLGSIVSSVLILGGLYFALWIASKGQWVGFGDVKLGVALGLLLIDWKLALLTLFLANLIGTLIVLPGLITHTLSRKTQVPFGPLLIMGFFISFVFGQAIIGGYDGFSNWLNSMSLMV